MITQTAESGLTELVHKIRQPLYIIKDNNTGQLGLSAIAVSDTTDHAYSLLGILPPLYPEWLGAQTFLTTHGVRFPYIVGEMANGIATAKMVVAAARTGTLGFFGAAGLLPDVIEKNLQIIQEELGPQNYSWGSNLIHSPNEPGLEAAAVDLYLKYQIRRVSASAYMTLNPNIIYYACKGLSVDPGGNIQRQNYVLAKLSRPEIARQFMNPPPANMLQALVESGKLTRDEAMLAAHIPVAEDITVEGDSGGHTDNRPLGPLFSTIYRLAEELQRAHNYPVPFRIGAAGGLGTPASLAAAFSLGAAYVLTGSINQAAVEAGLSEEGRLMLAQADIADVMMAPAADMFELGVKLQILKKGTLFGARATKLYDIYTKYQGLEEISAAEKNQLEAQIFLKTLNEVWQETENFFAQRDPHQLEKAAKNSKYRMGLVFRWYLGLASRWAIAGESSRKIDYQIWCGPAMGAFNSWTAGSF